MQKSFDYHNFWSVWASLIFTLLISISSVIRDILPEWYTIILFILLGFLLFSIILGKYLKIKENKINKIALLLISILKKTFDDDSINIKKRTFDEHKTKSDAQEVKLQRNDEIIIIASDLEYDLDDSSLKMITKNLLKGAKYEYLLEKTQKNIEDAEKLVNGIRNNNKTDKQKTLENIKVKLLPENKFLYNFVIVRRPGKNAADHLGFYFTKTEDKIKYCYEILYDGNDELIEKLKTVYKELSKISSPLYPPKEVHLDKKKKTEV
jgi:hypothetical protein